MRQVMAVHGIYLDVNSLEEVIKMASKASLALVFLALSSPCPNVESCSPLTCSAVC